jgi:CheY-like chemotaxis protein
MAKKETAADPAAEQTKATKRILLVDDDGEIIEAMRFALESRGYTILVARDGNQGLAMAEREDPDLVILDMMMPKRSGFLVLEKLRRTRPANDRVKVIMITANEGSRHKAYAEMLEVDDFVNRLRWTSCSRRFSACWPRLQSKTKSLKGQAVSACPFCCAGGEFSEPESRRFPPC